MPSRYQSTKLNRNIGQLLLRLENWARNPWRRYSLFLIVLLSGFLLGRSIGAINGVLALRDPIGAFLAVLILELMVRFRRKALELEVMPLGFKLLDMVRMGLLYGLITEGFKLL